MLPNFRFIAAVVAGAVMTASTIMPAAAGGYGGGGWGGGGGGWGGGGGGCGGGGGGGSVININKNINISKTIDLSKNINISKNITINKGGDSFAFAQAMASANANASVTIYSGSNNYVNVNSRGESAPIGAIKTASQCVTQDATVVKAIHAVCISADGREFPASHMVSDTWIDSSYEGEILRCIPGSHLKVVIGDVLQSDQGMAGTYSSGTVLQCAEHEAVRHFKDGMLKCAPAVAVPDCTERTNLRKYGTGDMFFSFRTMVCATATAKAEARELELEGLALNGGVGDDAY